MTSRVPFIKPRFPDVDDVAADLRRIYANNYYSNNGPVYFEFRDAIEKYLGQDLHAVVVANATTGLQLAIEAVFGSRRPKKYIAIPSFTFSAGPLAIKWCGFEPIFFDIDETTAQPDLASFHSVLEQFGKELAGVVLINDFGIGNPELESWEELLRERDVPIIIDSAPGFGSTYENGKLLGAGGICEVFSFHATKPFGIGEGGLITTRDAALADNLESLKNFGFNATKETDKMGMNAKITELDCAIGLRVLKKYEATLQDRRHTYGMYHAALENHVQFLPHADSAAIQFASIIVEADKRDTIIDNLRMVGVEVRTYYAPAVHTFSFFDGAPRVSLAHTEALSQKIISLPVHPFMDKVIVNEICDVIIKSI